MKESYIEEDYNSYFQYPVHGLGAGYGGGGGYDESSQEIEYESDND